MDYLVGDLQGCCDPLERLLQTLDFSPSRDRLYLLGDLVNRGPDSLGVLRYVRGLGDSAVTVMGNHDLHLLAIAAGVRRPRHSDTVQDVLEAPDRTELLEWLRTRPLLHRDAGLVLVHAGLLPQWTVDTAAVLAKEAEDALRSPQYGTFMRTLYETQLPSRWSDELAGPVRGALIATILTRLRICTPDGTPDFSFGDPPDRAPAGFHAWFEIPGRKSAGTTIVCGHWAALGLHLAERVIALDSGCVWGRQLSAIRLEDREVFQVSCAGKS